MPLKLYKINRSPPARAVMMLLDILNLEHETVDINVRNKENLTPEFLKLNPVHTIPVLEDGDLILQDSHAILMYLMDKYAKDDALYPKDIVQRAMVNQKLFFDTGFLFFRLRVIAQGAFYQGQKSVSDKQNTDVIEAYGFLEEYLSKTKFLAGDHITIADISAIAYVTSLAHLIPINVQKYPLTDAWIKYMEKQPYEQKFNAPGSLELVESIKTSFSNN